MRALSPAFAIVVLLASLWFAAAGGAAEPTTVRVLVVKATWGPAPEPSVSDLERPAVAFFLNASFNTVRLTFTETPWITAYADETICTNIPLLLNQGQSAAQAYDPSSFDRVIYVTPCRYVDAAVDTTHRGTVGLPASPALFEHELGHTFGMSHAGTLDCSSVCSLNPYGSPFDVMGSGTGDFGALQKAEAGWPINVRTVTKSGTYRIAALEATSTLPQALVVRRGAYEYWIDHREAIKNDATLKTSIWRSVVGGVLVQQTPADPLGVPFLQRRPDYLVGNGGPSRLWLTRDGRFQVPHVMTISVIRHVGTTVTVKLQLR